MVSFKQNMYNSPSFHQVFRTKFRPGGWKRQRAMPVDSLDRFQSPETNEWGF